MPYKLRKAPLQDLFWVVNTETKHKHSKLPLTRSKAEKQMRYLRAIEHGWKPKRRISGGYGDYYDVNKATRIKKTEVYLTCQEVLHSKILPKHLKPMLEDICSDLNKGVLSYGKFREFRRLFQKETGESLYYSEFGKIKYLDDIIHGGYYTDSSDSSSSESDSDDSSSSSDEEEFMFILH